MNIRTKTILSMTMTMIVLTVVLYLALFKIISDGFAKVEDSDANKDIERVRETLARSIETLCVQAEDWSVWDDAYKFVQDGNEEFIQSNIATTAMSSLHLSALIFFNQNGDVVTSTGYDAQNDRLIPVPAEILKEHFPDRKGLLIRRTNKDDVASGLLFLSKGTTFLFCSKPVLPTSGEGEVKGSMVFLSPFDRIAQEELMRTTKLKLSFTEDIGRKLKEPYASVATALRGKESRFIDSSDPKTLVGYTRLADYVGHKGLIVRIEIQREVYAQANISCRYLGFALIVFGIAFIAVTILLMEVAVLRRLAKLKTEVTRITESFDFRARVDGAAEDELGRLGLCINRLLAAVAQIQYAKAVGEYTEPSSEKGKENG